MDYGSLLSITGAIATVAFGGASLVLAFRAFYPGRVTFIQETCIGLFDSIVKNLPSLAITYNNSAIAPRLVLLKG